MRYLGMRASLFRRCFESHPAAVQAQPRARTNSRTLRFGGLDVAGAPAFSRQAHAAQPVPHKPEAVGGSHVTGDVDFDVKGRKVTVEVEANGLAPKLVHAQHIHGVGNRNAHPKRRETTARTTGSSTPAKDSPTTLLSPSPLPPEATPARPAVWRWKGSP